jgi:hypothetical protein
VRPFVDFINLTPVWSRYERLLAELKPLLTGTMTEEKKQAVRELINSKIQGNNYNPYVSPTDEELGVATFSELTLALENVPLEDLIWFERCALYALLKCYPDQQLIKMETRIEVLQNDAISLYQSERGHVVLVSASLFRIFAPNTSFVQCAATVHVLMVLQELVKRADLVTGAHAQRVRGILTTLLMNMEFGRKNKADPLGGNGVIDVDLESKDCVHDMDVELEPNDD